MCGIVGMAGSLDHSDKKRLDNLLRVCSVRGKDSTGVARIGSVSEPDVYKQVGEPTELIGMKAYDNLAPYGARAFIGHCRAATAGRVNKTNAHPFKHGHITGVHNGTLRYWSRDLDDDRLFDVDSDCLYHNIAKHGIENVIPNISGAWALVWWDNEAKTLNFLRNDERPLWMAWSEDAKKLFWASEYWMLDMLRGEGGGYTKLYKNDNGEMFFPLPINTHRSIKINPSGRDGKEIFTFLPDKELKGDSPKSGAVSSPFRGGWTSQDKKGTESGEKETEKGKESPQDTAVDKSNTSKRGTQSDSSETSKPSTASTPRRPLLSLVQTNSEENSEESKSLPGCNRDQHGKEIDYKSFHDKTGGVCSCCNEFYTEEEFDDRQVVAEWADDASFICTNCIGLNHYISSTYG